MSEFNGSKFELKASETPDMMDMLKDFNMSESGNLVRDLFTRKAVPPKEADCDTRPQSPLAGKLDNSCGLSIEKIFENVKSSTVKIFNSEFMPIGSGFYACLPGEKTCGVITNHHVARLADNKTVFMQSPDQLYLGKIAARDGSNDLAIIEPFYPKPDLKPVKFGPAPQKADPVLSVCYPTTRLSFPVLTAGKVLAPDARVHVNDGSSFLSPPSIITDQSIIGGCSGGPDFNKSGEFIGVTRANGSEGAVVIKGDHVIELLEKYRDG